MRAVQMVNECSDRAVLPVTSEGGSEEPKVIVSIYHPTGGNVNLSCTTYKFCAGPEIQRCKNFSILRHDATFASCS